MTTETTDITNVILIKARTVGADYKNTYEASVVDITHSLGFDADVTINN